jgi:hypothetical protein
VLVSGAQDADVLLDDLLALVLEGLGEDVRRLLDVEAHQVEQRAQRHRVLHHRQDPSEVLRQLGHGKRHDLDPLADERGVAVQLRAVEEDRAPRLHVPGVALDAVLVERDQHVQVVPVAEHPLLGEPHP